MRRLTASVQLHFVDLEAEDSQAATDAVRQAIVAMHEQCRAELADALDAVGARLVQMDIIVF